MNASDRSIDVTAHVENTPEAVIAYIADVRNRPMYLPMLKAVDEVQDDPAGVTRSWKWTFGLLGLEFEGTGMRTSYEPARLYAFETQGGIPSRWTYQAEPEGNGTRLSVHLEYEIPEKALGVIPVGAAADALRQQSAETAVKNLKSILDR
jgi:carbon monoxide dehydrogenase subunit G